MQSPTIGDAQPTVDARPTGAIDNADNPFASEVASEASSTGYQYFPRGVYFKSRRVKKDEVDMTWLKKKDPREKWMTIIPLIGILIGLGIAGVLVWDGVRSVAQHKYCEVLNDDFSSWNSNIWSKEVEVGGFG
jgi:hypothetical protein